MNTFTLHDIPAPERIMAMQGHMMELEEALDAVQTLRKYHKNDLEAHGLKADMSEEEADGENVLVLHDNLALSWLAMEENYLVDFLSTWAQEMEEAHKELEEGKS